MVKVDVTSKSSPAVVVGTDATLMGNAYSVAVSPDRE